MRLQHIAPTILSILSVTASEVCQELRVSPLSSSFSFFPTGSGTIALLLFLPVHRCSPPPDWPHSAVFLTLATPTP